jgi:hypothetical protein
VTSRPAGAPATLADGLAQLAAAYDRHAPALAGTGEDLLQAALATSGEADPAALRQALAPRLRPLLDQAALLDQLAVSLAPAGDLDGGRPAGDAQVWPWPRLPEAAAVAAALRLRDPRPRLVDASVVRLTVTRVVQTASEEVRWAPGGAPPTPTYDGDVRAITGGDQGWTDARWEGVRAGSVQQHTCATCAGSGRVRCAVCGGAGVEPCPELEPCRICNGSGKRPRTGRELLRGPCAACNGRGAVPCPRCGGQGRRPCHACGGGTVACGTCHGHGRTTRYTLGVVERRTEVAVQVDAEALRRLGRGADRHFRPLARLTGDTPPPEDWPPEVGEQVRAALEPVSPDQVRQRLQADVLPAVAVTTGDRGQERTLYLLGEEEDLARRAVVRPRRGRLAGRWPRG